METPENELNTDSNQAQDIQAQTGAPDTAPEDAAQEHEMPANETPEVRETQGTQEIFESAEEDRYIETNDSFQNQQWGYGSKSEIKGKTQKIDVGELENQNEQIDLVTVCGVRFESFEDEEPVNETPQRNLDIMQDVTMTVTVELGRTKSSVKKVLDMTKGSIVELEKVAGEPVELFVNGKLVGYGEVIVMEEKFGLRVTNIAKPKTLS